MKSSKPVQVLRWFAVLPGAILGALLVSFPVHWAIVLYQLFDNPDESIITINGKSLFAAIPIEILEGLGLAFFVPLVMIVVGTKIAPSHKFQTGIALAVLWGILFVSAATIVISRGQYVGWQWLIFVLTCVLGIAGVRSGLYRVHKAEKAAESA